MAAPESARRQEAQLWLDEAHLDMATVRHLRSAEPPLHESSAYHLEQAAEKLMKGLLSLAGMPFRRSHDLDELKDRIAGWRKELARLVDPLRPRTTWAIVFRHPLQGLVIELVPNRAEIEATLACVPALRAQLAQLVVAEG